MGGFRIFFFVNLLGLVVFLGIGVLASQNRKEIQWRSVASLLTLNLMLAWFLTSFEIGREMITAAAAGFTELINISYVGIAFVFPRLGPRAADELLCCSTAADSLRRAAL